MVSTADNRERISTLMASADEDARLEGLRLLGQADPGACLDLVFQGLADASWRVRKEATELFLRFPDRSGRINEVIALLHAEENAGLRNAAVDILVRMGREAVPLLLDQAGCPDHDVRKFIVDILGEIADPRAIPTLLEALDDEDGNVRAAAAENLGKLRSGEAVPRLLDAMRHPDVLLRFTILDALGKIGAPIPLSRLLPFRNDPLLRKALIDCLGLVGDATAVSELLAGLVDPMRNVRETSLLSLVALADRYPVEVRESLAGYNLAGTVEELLVNLDEHQPTSRRQAAVRVLGWLADSRALTPLLQLLGDEVLQRSVLSALVNMALRRPQPVIAAWNTVPVLQRAYLAYVFSEAECADALPLLRDALGSEDARLAQMAVHALGRLGGITELGAMAACLRHADADVRDAAAHSLSNLGRRFPAEILAALEPLLEDNDPSHRSAAIGVIGRLEDPVVVQRLAMALKDPAAEVRRAAIGAFSGAAVNDHLLALQLALTDEDVDVRRSAAEKLGNSSNPEAIEGLRLALRDEDLWVRVAAVRSLGRLGGVAEAETIGLLLDDPVGLVTIAVLETLTELLGEQACPRICTALAHPDEEVASVALRLLSRFEGGAWLPANVEMLVNHPVCDVRAYGVGLLPGLLGEAARPILDRRLEVESDATVRQQIGDALRNLAAH